MTTNNGRTALITGASRGLGLALARGLAARGWNLILTARDAERLRGVRDELATHTHVAALAGDVIDPKHREALAVLARGHAGLDAVLNNAGLLGPSPQPPLLDYPLETLVEVFLANVLAPLAMIQELRHDAQTGRADRQRHERCGRQRIPDVGRLRCEQGRARTAVGGARVRKSRRSGVLGGSG